MNCYVLSSCLASYLYLYAHVARCARVSLAAHKTHLQAVQSGWQVQPQAQEPPVLCSCEGDPHCFAFSGYKCDMMGLGAFPLVRLPGILVDTFHCPVLESAVRAGASTIAGLAMRVGDDKVVVRGSEVKVNGHHLETSGTFGGLLLNTSNTSVVAKYEDLQLSSMVHRGAHSATGYLMNVQLETHSQPMSSGNASICGVNAGRQQIPQLGPLETLFDADDYAVRATLRRDPHQPPPTRHVTLRTCPSAAR